MLCFLAWFFCHTALFVLASVITPKNADIILSPLQQQQQQLGEMHSI
jgi:hypothetical protein